MLLSRLAIQGASFLQIVILARYLDPADFGLMAIASLVLTALDTFTTPGFVQALVHRQGAIDSYLGTVFWSNIARSVLVALGIVVLANPVSQFFSEPQATPLISSTALVILIRSFRSPAIAELHRAMSFFRYFLWEFTATIATLVTGVTIGVIYETVWSLLIALVVGELARTAGSYIAAPWKLTFDFDLSKLSEITSFGKWVVVGNSLGYLSLQLDNILVGRILGSATLGVYEVAFRISQLPATQIGQVVGTATFPTLTSVAHDPNRFKHVYVKIVWGTLVVSTLVSIAIVIFAQQIVDIALGPNWSEAINTIRILGIAGIARGVMLVGARVFYALGYPKADSMLNTIRTVIFLTLFYPLSQLGGIDGVAIAVLIASWSMIPAYFIVLRRLAGITISDHLTIT